MRTKDSAMEQENEAAERLAKEMLSELLEGGLKEALKELSEAEKQAQGFFAVMDHLRGVRGTLSGVGDESLTRGAIEGCIGSAMIITGTMLNIPEGTLQRGMGSPLLERLTQTVIDEVFSLLKPLGATEKFPKSDA
jgi:hypothetical protein